MLTPEIQDIDTQCSRFLLSWNQFEIANGRAEVIDFNVSGLDITNTSLMTFESGFDVIAEIQRLKKAASSEYKRSGDIFSDKIFDKLTAHEFLVRALYGQRFSIDEYLKGTMQLPAIPYSDTYLSACSENVRSLLEHEAFDTKLDWSKIFDREHGHDKNKLRELFLSTFETMKPYLYDIVPDLPDFDLKVEYANEDAYWGYWVMGTSEGFLLKFNTFREINYTPTRILQMAIHELLVHCQQTACWGDRIEKGLLPRYLGLTTVHTPEQFTGEGIAHTIHLLFDDIIEKNPLLKIKIYMDHLRFLVLHNIHLLICSKASIEECIQFAGKYLPHFTHKDIMSETRNRSINAVYSAYQYVYSTGYDYFLRQFENKEKRNSNRELVARAFKEYLRPQDVGFTSDNIK